MKHTLHDNILGEIDFEGDSYSFFYLWPDSFADVFHGVKKLQVMKTGCYVLHRDNGYAIVPPGFRYCIETKEEPTK